MGYLDRREIGRWTNNRAENSHLPFRRRERAVLRSWRMTSLRKFTSVHANVRNHFNLERYLADCETFKLRRFSALAEWREIAARIGRSVPRVRLVKTSSRWAEGTI